MGLDITAYRRLRKVAPGEGKHPKYDDETDYENGYVRVYVNADFSAQSAGIDSEAIYKAEESHGFRAGSYSGYNAWRDELARLAGFDGAESVWSNANALVGLPFVELINFSDCEGVIGPAVSAKLARDFAELQSKADAHPDEWFREKYGEWRRAFEMAADSGAVRFH